MSTTSFFGWTGAIVVAGIVVIGLPVAFPIGSGRGEPLPRSGKGGSIRPHPQSLRWLGARLAFGRVSAFPGPTTSLMAFESLPCYLAGGEETGST